MMFWHASVAKNTAHAFAMRSELELNRRFTGSLAAAAASSSASSAGCGGDPAEMILGSLMLINCDCDNVFDETFVVGSVRSMMASRAFSDSAAWAEPPLCSAGYASGGQASLAGRLAYWASDFLRLGGYDQEEDTAGSAYQDVDICLRLKKATGSRAPGRGVKLTKSLGLGVLNKIGATTQQDRGPVKIENCSPADLVRMPTWPAFYARNLSVMAAKTAAGRLVRNLDQFFGGGAPALSTPLPLLLRALDESTGALWAATQARSMPATRF